ncbi:MAG: ATP-dependent helicase UvrD/PcrA, partial [Methanolobus sp.]|nr:ATP-dependent helicase UvrD/PcrA [Methanolobus sp.]
DNYSFEHFKENKLTGIPVASALGVAEMRLIDVSEEGVEAVVDRVKEMVSRILMEDFEVNEDPNCRFCDYKGICDLNRR